MTRALKVLPALAILLALAAPAAAEARSCRSGNATGQRLSAKGVSCSVAKRVARAHARRDCARTCRIRAARRAWSCRRRGTAVRCKARGRRSVAWRIAAPAEQPPGTTPPPGGTAPPGGTTTPPGATQGFTRDDAGFRTAITANRLHKYEEGTYGFGDYAYNFFGDGGFAYCSTYSVNGGSAQGHRSGTWQVLEGYANPGQPGHYGGLVQLNVSDGSAVRIAVEVLGGQAAVEAGDASSTFAEGSFSRTEGGAAGC